MLPNATKETPCLFKCRIKVSRHSSKKNEKEPARARGRSYIRKTEAARHVEGLLIRAFNIEKIKQRIDDPIDCDIQAVFTFYFPKSVYFTKKGKRSHKLPDLSNLYQLPEDILQRTGIIVNDTQIESHDGSRRAPIDGVEYWLEIKILKFTPQILS